MIDVLPKKNFKTKYKQSILKIILKLNYNKLTFDNRLEVTIITIQVWPGSRGRPRVKSAVMTTARYV